MAIREVPDPAPIESVLTRGPAGGPGAELWWLGQAGFLLQAEGRSLLIDPCLSDVLARKYAGKVYPHVRAMPSPLAPERARGIDMVLCTHMHSDHMDPETLPLRGAPRCARPGAGDRPAGQPPHRDRRRGERGASAQRRGRSGPLGARRTPAE